MAKQPGSRHGTGEPHVDRYEARRRAVSRLLEGQADALVTEAVGLLLEGVWKKWADMQPMGMELWLRHEDLVASGDPEVVRLAWLSAALRNEAGRIVESLRGPDPTLN